jgi:hypothetical protein
LVVKIVFTTGLPDDLAVKFAVIFTTKSSGHLPSGFVPLHHLLNNR